MSSEAKCECRPTGIYEAMAAITRSLKAVPKGQQTKARNEAFAYKYRGIDDLYNHLKPLMAENGVFMLPRAIERVSESRQTSNGGSVELVTVTMEYSFVRADRSSVTCISLGQAMDSGDKATGKAMTAAHKYALIQTFCVPTADIDDPDAVNNPAPQPQTHPRQTSAVQPPAGAPVMASKEQLTTIGGYLKKKHGDKNVAGMLDDLSGFLGRTITSSEEVTAEEAAAFIETVMGNRK